MSAVADKLREARALIEAGWTRGEFKRRGNCYCALGAIAQATVGEHNPDAEGFYGNYLYRDAVRALAEAAEVGTSRVVDWNDIQPSKKPVLAAFDKAIELAEAQQ